MAVLRPCFCDREEGLPTRYEDVQGDLALPCLTIFFLHFKDFTGDWIRTMSSRRR